jgi:hypothetical protein
MRVRMRARGSMVRQIVLLPPAAFVVHQLRYLLAFGGGAGAALQRTGHSYLHSLVPWIMLPVALALGAFLRSLGRAFTGRSSVPHRSVSFRGMWLACSVGLIAIFVCQEFLEELFAPGHPTGLAGIFGYGGWWAIPVSVCVGLVLAAWFHGACWVLQRIVERRMTARRAWTGPVGPRARTPDLVVARLAPLVGGWSDRGPPRQWGARSCCRLAG